MTTYKIEKNIDAPASLLRPKKINYPFEQMAVGDSVFFPGKETTRRTEYVAAMIYQRNTGAKFKGCKVEGGIRIWRTE